VWLRHNCRCVECIHAGNGQRHVELADLPEHPAVETVWAEGALVRIRFRPDGHEGVFDRERLERWCRDDDALPYDPRTEDAKRLWPAGGGGAVRELAWAAYCDDDSAKAAALDGVLFDGAVLLTGVPARQRMVLDVARSLGFVRRTNYGELFDVRVEPNPTNLAFTSMSIAPTRTTRTATRCRPSSSCTVWTTLRQEGGQGSWTGSVWLRRCVSRDRPRSPRWRPHPSPSRSTPTTPGCRPPGR
jgi:gamma-butyrobetaine dioxygenase